MISVIVPIYKVEKYMDLCIRSILNQTYQNFELILVEDGSPDVCGRKCDEWAEKDERISVIHQANGGLSAARNAGIEQAKGDYLCFVDSDDWLKADYLETLYGLIRETGADMACCGFERVSEAGKTTDENVHIQEGVYSQDEFWKLFYFEKGCRTYYTVSWNRIYRRKLFEKLRFPCGLIHEDISVLYDLISECRSIALSPKVEYCYLQRMDSIMSSGRSVLNLAGPEAYLRQADAFATRQKWKFAGCALDIAIRYLLIGGYGKGGKRSPEYHEAKSRAGMITRRLWPNLPKPKKIRFFLFFTCPPLARLAEYLLTCKARAASRQ